jgi:hypothetical protein
MTQRSHETAENAAMPAGENHQRVVEQRRDRAGDDPAERELDEALQRRREPAHRREQVEQHHGDARLHERAADHVQRDRRDVERDVRRREQAQQDVDRGRGAHEQ